jgi:AraC-like DNA-binding protein
MQMSQEIKPNLPFNRKSLCALDLRVLSVQRTEAGRWWNYKAVASPFSRLWLILDGRAEVRHHNRRFVLRAGQIHLVPPFTVHDCHCANRFNHYHLHFVARLPTGIDLFSLLDFQYQMASSPEVGLLFRRMEAIYPNRKLPCFDPRSAEYKQFSLAADADETQTGAVAAFEARGVMSLLIAKFLKDARYHEGVHTRVTRQFLAVQEYIHANMHQTITLPDMAKVVKLHPTYFSDQFKRVVGIRPLDYLARRRIERAQYLLLSTPSSVKEIAGVVGIPDPAYFSRLFTRLCHKSPSEYRSAYSY